MPVALLVKNKANRQQDITKERLRACVGRKCMIKDFELCRCPEDVEGCQQYLIEAWRNSVIGQHCIIEGLKANFNQCREVLQDGLYRDKSEAKNPAGKLSSTPIKNSELEQACKEVVLFGYPLEIMAVQEVFYESYYKLVRSVIYKYGIRGNSKPSADDVFQNVFLGLHKQFRIGASVRGPFVGYITRVTINKCIEAKKAAQKQSHLQDEDEVNGTKYPSVAIIPFEAVELWEHFDNQLSASEHGNLINRIILGQQCIDGCSSGKRPSAKQLGADWQQLSQLSNNDIVALHEQVAIEIKESPSRGVVPLAADMINSGVAEPYQVAIIFAAATQMDMVQTSKLVDQLSNLSETAVYTRICRIYTVLQPPGMDDGK